MQIIVNMYNANNVNMYNAKYVDKINDEHTSKILPCAWMHTITNMTNCRCMFRINERASVLLFHIFSNQIIQPRQKSMY
jgi:hypothetical protein